MVNLNKQVSHRMLVATWVIAVAGLITAGFSIWNSFLSRDYYAKQIDEMKKATRFEWRPFLDIEHF
jgi:hypothetical protein